MREKFLFGLTLKTLPGCCVTRRSNALRLTKALGQYRTGRASESTHAGRAWVRGECWGWDPWHGG